MGHFLRHGDVNLHPVKQVEGKLVKTNGSFVLAEGEATGSKHILSVVKPEDLRVYKTELDTFYELLAPAKITHTHDHETITLEPGIYRQVGERELDHFADSVQRKVVD